MLVDGKCKYCDCEQSRSLIDDQDDNSMPMCCNKAQDEWLDENATVSKDGNQICVLVGKDLQSGRSGFGDTRLDAICDLIDTWIDDLKTK